MISLWTRWRRRRILQRSTLSQSAWRNALAALPLLHRLSEPELRRLRELVILFLHDKRISPAAGLRLTEETRLIIAAQACLLILNLDLAYYDGWTTIIVYPDEFVPEREYTDDIGVVHVTRHPLAGEAWLQGPIILSASDAQRGGAADGMNVVVHEFAHKLDMLNGDGNGFPPLHAGMNVEAWSRAFTQAYDALCREVDLGLDTTLDPYAAHSPAEFFAVVTEAFFETPRRLHDTYPAVYDQLALFYRQDPLRQA